MDERLKDLKSDLKLLMKLHIDPENTRAEVEKYINGKNGTD